MRKRLAWHCVKAAVILSALAICGCVNVAYTRNPFVDSKIEECYQSTQMAALSSWVVAFPQLMSDNPSDYRLMALNVITVPLGAAVLCDAACEGVVDTLCWPADYLISRSREK